MLVFQCHKKDILKFIIIKRRIYAVINIWLTIHNQSFRLAQTCLGQLLHSQRAAKLSQSRSSLGTLMDTSVLLWTPRHLHASLIYISFQLHNPFPDMTKVPCILHFFLIKPELQRDLFLYLLFWPHETKMERRLEQNLTIINSIENIVYASIAVNSRLPLWLIEDCSQNDVVTHRHHSTAWCSEKMLYIFCEKVWRRLQEFIIGAYFIILGQFQEERNW